ncbi:MAG: O-acetyl-ADP-ribose deacetylase [bacterium]
MSGIIRLHQGDITKITVDAIVNAANSTLLGGGGVDGAIHRAAGVRLLGECITFGGCATGDAVITGGYKLPAKHVIHTVGPIWRGGNKDEDNLLASCYQRSLSIAESHQLTSIAFPAISTGIYSFPAARAANIALREMKKFLTKSVHIKLIIPVLFDQKSYDLYWELLGGDELEII